MNKMLTCVTNLYESLSTNESKTDLFNRCVADRITKIVELQAEELDKQMIELENALDIDLKENPKNITHLSSALKSIYKCISRDRLQLFDALVSLTDNNY